MNNESNFESKIREKLEEYQPTYQDAYWKAYEAKYPLPWYRRISISWKSHAVFAYSMLAFALGYFLNRPVVTTIAKTSHTTDTLYIVKETKHTDSLVINHYQTEPNSNATGTQVQSLYPNKLVDSKTIVNFPTGDHSTHHSSANNSKSTVMPRSQDSPENSNVMEETVNNAPLAITDARKYDQTESENNPRVAVIATIDSSFSKPSIEIASDLPESTDSLNTVLAEQQPKIDTALSEEEKKIANLNQRKSRFEWGAKMDFLGIFPHEAENINYQLGGFAGIGLKFNYDRWYVEPSIHYGVSATEIDHADKLVASEISFMKGFIQLITPPEDLHINTQSLLSSVEMGYLLMDKPKFSLGLSAGILGIMPVIREFIYDYSWQNQIRTREAIPLMSQLTIAPSLGISANYHLHYQWEIFVKGRFNPTFLKTDLQNATAFAPITWQIGMVKYW